MPLFSTTLPTLLTKPTPACPRCDGQGVHGVTVDTWSAFEWRECDGCSHLWAIPRGWTPHGGPFVSHAA
jgi:hypothetical protein